MQTRPNYPWHIDLPRGQAPVHVFKTRDKQYVAAIKYGDGYLSMDLTSKYLHPTFSDTVRGSDLIIRQAGGKVLNAYPSEVEAVANLLQSVHRFIHGVNDDEYLRSWRKFIVTQTFGTREDLEKLEMAHTPSLQRAIDMHQLSTRQNPLLFRNNEEAQEYGKMVADAYRAAPSFDEKEVWRWRLLADHIHKMFKRIQRGKQGVEVILRARSALRQRRADDARGQRDGETLHLD